MPTRRPAAHPRSGRVVLVLAALALGVLAGCGDDDGVTGGDDTSVDVGLPDGYEATVLVDGLVGPTQVSVGPEGALLVAQLNGPEGSTDGEVLSVPADGGEPTVLFDGLDTPTGVILVGDEVWVMERRSLSRGPATGGALTPVVEDLPFNGRSEGSLGVTPEGAVLYDTSGAIEGDGAADGSATLWVLDPSTEAPEPLARGFKHAYAHTYGDDGTLWVTEMSDGRYDGQPAPDELVAVEPGDDFGWPRCVGDGTPVALYGGTSAGCQASPGSHALFEPGATPTSVAVAPWDPDTLLVALWNRGEVVAVPTDRGDEPVDPSVFLDGIERPQHLLSDGDRLLLTDHAGGRLVAVTAR